MKTTLRLTHLLVLLFIFQSLHGQMTVSLTPENRSKYAISDVIVIEDKVYVAKKNINGFASSIKYKTEFIRVNQQLEIEARSELRLKVSGKKTEFVKFLNIANQLYMLSRIGSKTSSTDLIISKIDRENLEIIEDQRTSIFLKKKGLVNGTDYNVRVAPNHEYLLFSISHDVRIETERKYQFIVLDQQLETVLDTTIFIEGSTEKFKESNSFVDNQGNVFFGGMENKSDWLPGRSWANLLRLNRATKEITEIRFKDKSKDKYLKDFNFTLKGKDIIVGGLYSEEERNIDNFVRGALYAKFSTNFEEGKELTFLPYSTDVLHHGFTEYQIKELQEQGIVEEYHDLKLKEIFYQPNGYALFIVEQTYLDKSMDAAVRGGKPQEYFCNMLISYISPEGKILWTRIIAKKWVKDNWVKRHSYYFFPTGSSFNFIYNDGRGNSEQVNGGYLMNIKPDGTFTHDVIINKKEDDIYLSPLYSRKINEKKVFLYGRAWLDDRFGILEFE